jgi:hypothetical protein
VAGRPSYDPRAAGIARSGNPDRDRFDARRRQFQNWYVNTYPNLLGYPYLLNPNFYNLGLYDWSDSDNSTPSSYEPDSYESDSSQPGSYLSDQNDSAPDYPPYPNDGYYAPNQIAAAAAPAVPTPTLSARPLSVFFKSGRAPIEVQNYLLTAKVLTDLDSDHYEQIPMDQIDLAATKRFNNFAGVDFQVPVASRD